MRLRSENAWNEDGGGPGFESRRLHLYAMKETDLYWLAGILEGEGSFMCGPPSDPRQPRIGIQTTDEDVIRHVQLLIGGTVAEVSRQREHHRRTWTLKLKGLDAIIIMQRLRPLMGKRRREQIELALESARR